jgi:hypothetical protein
VTTLSHSPQRLHRIAEGLQCAAQDIHQAGVTAGVLISRGGDLRGVGVESTELNKKDLPLISQRGASGNQSRDHLHLVGEVIVRRDARLGAGKGIIEMCVQRGSVSGDGGLQCLTDDRLGQPRAGDDALIRVLHQVDVAQLKDVLKSFQALAPFGGLVVRVLKIDGRIKQGIGVLWCRSHSG